MFKDMATKKTILASSPNIENLASHINSYFYSVNYSVNKETLKIENINKSGEQLERLNNQFSVIFKRGRYQFFINI